MPMNYQELRSQAQDGDIVFLHVNPRDWMSRLTAWATGSRLTHVAFLFWYRGRLLVAESTTEGGSRIALASHYQNRTFELQPAPVPWDSITTEALRRSGAANYGWFSSVYIGVRHWLLAHAAIRLPKISGNRDKACSEYVAEILELPDPDITPQQLWEYLND